MRSAILPAILALLTINAHTAELREWLNRAATYSPGQNQESLRQLEAAVASSITNQTLRGELELGFIRILTEPASYEARKFACEQLAIIGTADAVPALAAMLEDPNSAHIACLALRDNPSAHADHSLRAALPQAEGKTRIQIIHTLGDRRDPESVSPLALIARGSDHPAAAAAIAALGKVGDATAQRVLASLRAEADRSLSPAIAEASLRVAERRVVEANLAAAKGIYEGLLGMENPNAVRRGALSALLALDSDGGTRRILSLIKGLDSVLQPTAIAAVEGLVGAEVSRSFGMELPNLEPHVQALLIEALAGRGDRESRSAIAGRVADENPTVRLAAINALGRIGGAPAVPALMSAFARATTADETAAAQSALVRLPRDSAVDQAILAQMESAPAQVKPALIVALGQRRARSAWPVLLVEAGNPTAAIARAAWQTLARLATADDAPILLECMNNLPATAGRDDAETAIARALVQIDDPSSRSALLRAALESAGSVETRCSLLRLLPQAAEPAALAILESATRDANPLVADAAVRAVTRWPDADAWDLLWLTYHQSANDSHRSLALRALVRLAEEQNTRPVPVWIARYRMLLENASQDTDRKLILGALSGMAHPDALELAVSQLGHAEARAEAALTVKRIAGAIKDRYPDAAREALRRVE